jgi:hypothetical protein
MVRAQWVDAGACRVGTQIVLALVRDAPSGPGTLTTPYSYGDSRGVEPGALAHGAMAGGRMPMEVGGSRSEPPADTRHLFRTRDRSGTDPQPSHPLGGGVTGGRIQAGAVTGIATAPTTGRGGWSGREHPRQRQTDDAERLGTTP